MPSTITFSFGEAGLIKPSTIKPIFTTVEKALILKKLGTLAKEDQIALKKVLAEILKDKICFRIHLK